MARNDVNLFWKTPPQTQDDFLALGNKFFRYLKQINYSQQTIDAYRIHLRLFVLWCNNRSIFTPKEINHFTMDIYQLIRVQTFFILNKGVRPFSRRQAYIYK
ncbi:hypothetical protein [Candidatus Uabimicrobium sp. HlEnr_7]|uniref:hypothetical protein n=1 Tax=Candidatus Uabimicrobium helgolandensis TaxID=3095367 RepID=UPI00355745EC